MTELDPINDDEIKALLSQTRSSSSKKVDITQNRDVVTWFNLNHVQKDSGCDNPNCKDPRPEDHRGRKIGSVVKGQHMCRDCFLTGWLLDVEV